VDSDERSLHCQVDTAQAEFERIEGELEAAVVFAAAADQAYQNGNFELAAACLSDAKDGYAKALNALQQPDLTGAQLQDLKAKLIGLRERLGGVATPATHAAA
jgi:hypothetical protein